MNTTIRMLAISAVVITGLLARANPPAPAENKYAAPPLWLTTVSFGLSGCQPVRIEIYDTLGRYIGMPIDTTACDTVEVNLTDPYIRTDSLTGAIDTLWGGTGTLSSGFYYFRVITPTDTVTEKFVFMP